jgi:hypothetical protein
MQQAATGKVSSVIKSQQANSDGFKRRNRTVPGLGRRLCPTGL